MLLAFASVSFSQKNDTRKTDSLLTVFSNPKANIYSELLSPPTNKQTTVGNIGKNNMPCYKANMNEVEKMPIASLPENLSFTMPIISETYIDKVIYGNKKFKIINGKLYEVKPE